MRLTAIKLAGFKSFVDPTTFSAPSNLTGIVGPNGCGKSNIIDAVRWVMGEGSAKVLRGESMSDVIFSGSSARKPVGTATVELVFDNSDGRIAGEFAGYNEISVKRQVGRDGISYYTLNGTRCRRKDIRDLFLGTGLGSKSYSIIEQGMISRVVDAGPDEIRSHLEEAAGISRYKERRRETERRIERTRENLDRLSDLREEIAGHLSRLKRQARAAERYRKLKTQQREQEAMLLALKWSGLQESLATGRSGLGVHETALQEQLAEQRRAEAGMEELHQQQAAATEAFNNVQAELYAVGSEIARLEQDIAHQRDLQARQKQEHEETSGALQDMEKHMVLDRAQVEDLTQKLAQLEPQLAAASEQEGAADAEMQAAEAEVQRWQESLEAHHARRGEQNREADHLRATIEMLEQRIGAAGARLDKLGGETEGIDTAALSGEVKTLEQKSRQASRNLAQQQERLRKSRDELQARRKELRDETSRQHEMQGELSRLEGRLESLKALQQAARESGSSLEWLQQTGLSSAPRLLEKLDVEKGWETAVETVLGFWLEGLLVDDPGSLSAGLGELLATDPGAVELTLIAAETGEAGGGKGSLAQKVQVPGGGLPAAIGARLGRIRTAASLDAALKAVKACTAQESVITQRGEWLGPGWIRVAGSQSGQAGKLQRKQQIKGLQTDISRLTGQVSELEKANRTERGALEGLEQSVNELQQRVNELHRESAEVSSRLEASRTRVSELGERQQSIAEEIAALQRQRDEDTAGIKRSRAGLAAVLEKMAATEEERKALDQQRLALLERRDKARASAREARERRHELALKTESRRASLESLHQSLERMDTQFAHLQQRFLALSEQIAQNKDPQAQHRGEMEGLLEKRITVEQRLTEARDKLQQFEEDYRKLDTERQQSVRKMEDIRGDLERARLKQQELELNARTLSQQVEHLGQDVEALAADLPDDADEAQWQEKLERLALRITRLEPVNLAAISEYEEELKRKEYMDAQHADLVKALETLEDAIKTIDRKTRTRFKDTFEKVNKGIQELFPRLFGGGHAYLELTGDDLLTTGVAIMARPPGKRISNIQLMSGGEKALTAVSFVFAIFRLNPAPFCLLDEVDAPLDDANVSRFTEMVREMSESIQFIVVTHNKITMELAHQLSGVTMSEPGVSRLVQVDVNEAARLAGE